ncbi:MAG: TIGR04255 family protein [Bifidobacteriaceae bacterium]|nr:TIGR04255 family protein [Bifidobacteriaceae bacterium]
MDQATYANPSVVLALFQIKHLPTPRVDDQFVAATRRLLADLAPLHRADVPQQIRRNLDPAVAEDSLAFSQPAPLHHFYNRSRDLAITYGPNSLSVEASAYCGWKHFSSAIRTALSLLARPDGTLEIDGIERVGLRYVDEIRVPTDGLEPDWADWIAPDLLAPELPDEFTLVQQQSLILYSVNRGSDSLALRYGAVNGPSAFASTAYLTRAEVQSGPYFLLDTDAFWLPKPGDPLAEPRTEVLMKMADRLHVPAKAAFERSITDRLRARVLNRG